MKYKTLDALIERKNEATGGAWAEFELHKWRR